MDNFANFLVFCSKFPRTRIELHCNADQKTQPCKGSCFCSVLTEITHILNYFNTCIELCPNSLHLGLKYTNNSRHLGRKLGYLSADITCSENQTNEGYCVYHLSNLSTIRPVFTIGEQSQIFPSFSWGILDHVKCLDQLHAS